MLDRKLQKEILEKLAEEYPSQLAHYVFKRYDSTDCESRNMHYLADHGLVEISQSDGGVLVRDGPDPRDRVRDFTLTRAKITHAGMDFLENDGGLTAILGTVTVKLHADTIRHLIDAKILESTAIPEQDKPALREAIKGMKEEGLKQLTTRLISYGLDQSAVTAQQLWQWIGS